MKNSTRFFNKLKKILRITLIITLVLGILSSALGVTVVAVNQYKTNTAQSTVNESTEQIEEAETDIYESPTKNYAELKNEVSLKENVTVLTVQESKDLTSSITTIESNDGYYGDTMTLTLEGEDHKELDDLSYDDIVYIQGDETSPLGDDRIFRVEGVSSYNDKTYLEVSEPYLEDVFENMEIAASDALTEDNLVNSYYASGVTSHFGNVETEMPDVTNKSDLSDDTDLPTELPPAETEPATENAPQTTAPAPTQTQPTQPQTEITEPPASTGAQLLSYVAGSKTQVQTLGAASTPQVQTMAATDNSTKLGDLIIEVDYDFNKNKDKEESSDDNTSTSFGIKGTIGLRDLTSHLVCDMPTAGNFEELYLGLSGEKFWDIDLYGSISAEAQMEASKKETALFSFEGLNEKRFPIAVFQFKGTTPVYISNTAFENSRESIIPSLFLVVYADWEGNISLELNGGIESSDSFNSGLRVFKEGELAVSFENYPYTQSYDVESQDGLAWDMTLELEAYTDLTLLGGSVLFYVAGVNIGEVSIARLGVQAECNASVSANSKEGVKLMESDDTEFFIRGYFNLIEVKVKLKAEGKSFLSNLSFDIDFEFGLLKLTLFEHGLVPEQYKTKLPVSSMVAPTEFASLTTMVFDVSGSMYDHIDTGQTKLEAAKEAANSIIDTTEQWSKTYDGNYGFGIVMFSDDAQTVSVPHVDYDYLRDCIESMEDGGGTEIYSGIDTGVAQLDSVTSDSKVMILMTDGQDSYESETLESAEKAAEKGIKIYTIGFGDDVNEDILTEIAETTGGEYRFATTDNIMGIIGSFIYAQQASTSQVLTEIEDTVSEGETSDPTSFNVEDKSGDLVVINSWPGSFLDTILVDPTGRVVDEDYPNSYTDESQIPSTIIVNNPIKGEWTVSVKGVETSYEEEPFYTIVSFKELDAQKINSEMTTAEVVAAYCISVGSFTAVASFMLLFCIGRKRKEEAEKQH